MRSPSEATRLPPRLKGQKVTHFLTSMYHKAIQMSIAVLCGLAKKFTNNINIKKVDTRTVQQPNYRAENSRQSVSTNINVPQKSTDVNTIPCRIVKKIHRLKHKKALLTVKSTVLLLVVFNRLSTVNSISC